MTIFVITSFLLCMYLARIQSCVKYQNKNKPMLISPYVRTIHKSAQGFFWFCVDLPFLLICAYRNKIPKMLIFCDFQVLSLIYSIFIN